ncbi:uncharacterized protein UV8b_01423 [Ustilaginoidea virens]|uniref:Succinyl-3-ketoacid-coenzyme a transferase n=1 Tax=Ustilaginoidea virens TaxID=1159556 RepID=A0A8E5MF91_USTVR|nr:uncharacterized protein UV8b_01423 [Ustilaginoidea virens]QUC17182.1 hypothetical protein UV8b_01423 [Ustilaginoidea virens]
MFDESSGQVFKEWTVPRQSLLRGSDRDWSRQTPYPLLSPRGTKGPRSLVDMAVHLVANNIGDITERHLDGFPTRLLWRVWRLLEARQHICQPTDELRIYIQPLSSQPADFITHLVISGGCRFSTHELLCLSSLNNLGALELIQPREELQTEFMDVNDRLLRGWTETRDPFPLLRVLRIWVSRGITQESLQWVSKFPSLALYDVMAPKSDWDLFRDFALDNGWELADHHHDGLLLPSLIFSASMGELRKTILARDLRRVDSELISLSSGSCCSVKFVPNGQAPSLLDYLTDATKASVPTWSTEATFATLSEARPCHRVAFEAWAFWTYSYLGQLGADQDLRLRGVEPHFQACAGPFVLPSKRTASVYLGHNSRGGIDTMPSYAPHGLFSTSKIAFIRRGIFQTAAEPTTPRNVAGKVSHGGRNEQKEPRLRSRKKQKLNDMLQSLIQ